MSAFKKPSFAKPATAAPTPPTTESAATPSNSPYDKIGRGYLGEGKKGEYIKVMIDEGVEVHGGDYLFLFENKNKKGEKSPDFMVTRKAE